MRRRMRSSPIGCAGLVAAALVAIIVLLGTQPISSATSNSNSSSSGRRNNNTTSRATNSSVAGSSSSSGAENCTELARDDETLLVFSTLGGGLTAVDPITSEVRWSIEDEPAISVPTPTGDDDDNDDDDDDDDGEGDSDGGGNGGEAAAGTAPYLPDPRDGSLYQLGVRGGLKKLPYTIPQLVASAPCRSSDGILYSGKKSDTWYLIDPKTGRREKVLDFGGTASGSTGETIGWATSRSLYLGRTQYTVMMYDSVGAAQRGPGGGRRQRPAAPTKPWNVTFFDYAAHTMAPEVSAAYEWLHLTAAASGRTAMLDRQRGTFMWQRELESPVVAVYLLGADGLLSVPFTTVSDGTLASVVEMARDGQKNDVKLFQTLYVGEHPNGLYAIPSLADRNVPQISAEAPIHLIEGPVNRGQDRDSFLSTLLERNDDDDDDDDNDNDDDDDDDAGNAAANNVILLGHYQMPQVMTDLKLNAPKLSAAISAAADVQPAVVGKPPNARRASFEVLNINTNNGDRVPRILPPSRAVDDADDARGASTPPKSATRIAANRTQHSTQAGGTSPALRALYARSKRWLNDQESKILKLLLIVLMGMIVAMFWYMRHTVRELRQQSQSGSNRGSGGMADMGAGAAAAAAAAAARAAGTSYQELIDLGAGEQRVGKIRFNTAAVLGKGCEGTFVFRGTFERRAVAVKRLLPECFTLADREVALLRESDAHENVVRYFCTESDRQFRYIAVELCAATLQEYVERGVGGELQRSIGVLEVLRQATAGLEHLHALHIVHRDIKPQNVLLSLPGGGAGAKGGSGAVRAMISDFGLCKKLNVGRASFSRRSGVTGTDGWIAPEMLKGQRTTTAVDIFSLGCVYYYVLSHGKHPFGEPMRRQANILADEPDMPVFAGNHSGDTAAADADATASDATSDASDTAVESSKILAEQLITAMIAPDPAARPSATALLNHPFFWAAERVLAFLQDVSDRVEKLDFAANPLRTLEKNGRRVVREDWPAHLHEAIRADLRKYRGYHGNSVRDLLRALRNKKHHYHELSADMQRTLGAVPVAFTGYWVQRFPRLVAHAFHALESCAREPAFRPYYTEGYVWPKCEYFGRHYEEFVPAVEAPATTTMVGGQQQQQQQQQQRRYAKGGGLRQRTTAAAATSRAADEATDEQPPVGTTPRATRRGEYNFARLDGMATGGGGGGGAETVLATNWRMKVEPAAQKQLKQQTPAWTMPSK